MDQGPEFADRLKTLIASAKSRLDDAKSTASSQNASCKADERSAQQAEASARAASREAARACDALPSDTRAKLASIKKKCAALKDAEKAAAEDVEDEAEDDVKGGATAASRRVEAPSRHRCDSFGPRRETTMPRAGRGRVQGRRRSKCVRVGSHRQGRRRLGLGDAGLDASGAE